MPVPNALTRIINKHGEVVSFDLSRVHNSLTKAIIDVEHVSSWEAKERALKYSELIRDRIYKNFYDVNHLCCFFGRMISSWKPEEREERMRRLEFAPRLTALFLLHFSHSKKYDKLEDSHRPELTKMIRTFFSEHIQNPEINEPVSKIFSDKVYEKNQLGLDKYDQYPSRSFIQDQIEQCLKDIGEVAIAEGFMIYREGKRKIKLGEISEAQFTHNGIHKDRVRQTLLWNTQNECDSVFALNDWVSGRGGKDFKELMRRADQRFYDDIARVVEKIVDRADEIKVCIIAGPSCSNKTTTTTIIEQELAKSGLKLKQLNIDDYFFNL